MLTPMAVYLDSNATTQIHPDVLNAMMPWLSGLYHNPSAGYRAGQDAKAAINVAREQVADLLNAQPSEIVFTGCGTESNNMALKSLARTISRKKSRIVTSTIEYSAVLRPLEAMGAVGFDVTHIGTGQDGRLKIDDFRNVVDSSRPGFATVMWANNESGVIQPVDEICRHRPGSRLVRPLRRHQCRRQSPHRCVQNTSRSPLRQRP